MNNSLGVNDDPPPPYEYAAGDHARRSHDSGTTSTSQQGQQSHQSQGQEQGAAAYFASRPSRSSAVYTHTLYIGPNTRRSDLSHPAEWASNHDVSAQDWETFVGYLLPEVSEASGDGKRMSDEKARHIEGVVREWNDGFFQSRGVVIRWDDGLRRDSLTAGSSSQPQRHPSQSYHQQHHGPPPPQPRPPQPRMPQPRPPQPAAPNPQFPPRHMSTKERWTRKLKDAAEGRGVSVTPSKIRVGEMFSLDATSGNLKIGKFSMNESGMNYDGRPLGPQLPPGAHHPHLHPHHGGYQHQGHYGPHYGRGRGYGSPHGGYNGSPHSPHYPGPYRSPAHSDSWSPSPNSPHPGSYGPRPSQTWSPHGPSSPGGSYGPFAPSSQYRPTSPYDGQHNSGPHTASSNHPGQTTGTIG